MIILSSYIVKMSSAVEEPAGGLGGLHPPKVIAELPEEARGLLPMIYLPTPMISVIW